LSLKRSAFKGYITTSSPQQYTAGKLTCSNDAKVLQQPLKLVVLLLIFSYEELSK